MVLALKVPWRYNTPYFSDFQHSTLAHTVEMEGGVVGDGVADVIVQRRAGIQQAYGQLRRIYPLLPEQLRDFQVSQSSAHLCLQKKYWLRCLILGGRGGHCHMWH